MMNDGDEAGREAAAEAALKETRETGGAVVIDDTATDDAAADNTAAGGTEEKIVDAGVGIANGEEVADAGTDSAEPGELVEQKKVPATYEEFQQSAGELLTVGHQILRMFEDTQTTDALVDRFVVPLIADTNNLLETKFARQDKVGLYPDLLKQKNDLIQLQVKFLLDSFPRDLLIGHNNPDKDIEGRLRSVATALATSASSDPITQEQLTDAFLTDLMNQVPASDFDVTSVEAAEEIKAESKEISAVDVLLNAAELAAAGDPGKKKQILQAKTVWKLLGIAGMVAGATLKIFFEKQKLDLEAFLSFILNPIWRSGAGYEFRQGEEKGEVPRHYFTKKFEDYRLVGKALYKCAAKLTPSDWYNENQNALYYVKENVDAVKTHDLLLSYYQKALLDSNSGSVQNWATFKEFFASALFEDDSVVMDEDSVRFLKEKFENNGKKLKELWHISESGGVATPTKSESEPKPGASRQ